MELVYNKSKPVAVTGMAFPTGDVNNYVVGSEEGTVYTASRHGRLVDTHTHTRTHIHGDNILCWITQVCLECRHLFAWIIENYNITITKINKQNIYI